MSTTAPVQLIAVVGGSGAGKGWLVERLCRLLGDKATHLQLDNFYRDRSHLPMSRRAKLNFDLPEAIDWDRAGQVLRACREGRPAAVPRYDFATHCRVSEDIAWEPRPIVMVDGLWLLRPPEIRALFDFRIYLDTPPELRRMRRLTRDVAQRGYTRDTVEQQLRTSVMPMHARYVEPQQRWADLVLAQPYREADLVALADRVWNLLANAALVNAWEQETFRSDLVDLLSNHETCN